MKSRCAINLSHMSKYRNIIIVMYVYVMCSKILLCDNCICILFATIQQINQLKLITRINNMASLSSLYTPQSHLYIHQHRIQFTYTHFYFIYFANTPLIHTLQFIIHVTMHVIFLY